VVSPTKPLHQAHQPDIPTFGEVAAVHRKHMKVTTIPKTSFEPTRDATCPVPTLSSPMQTTGIYPQANHSIMLPWATGRMCWTMITDSSVFMHTCPRKETVVAGPSGHAHALLTFMRIFKSFDVEKWTLICIVWLVGADILCLGFSSQRRATAYRLRRNTPTAWIFTRGLLRSIAPRYCPNTR